MNKTNVMRMLDSAKILYTSAQYEYDENDLSGVHAAEVLGLQAEMVFKTLVAKGDRTGVTGFVIPVSEELDLKKAASVSKNKKIEMLHVKELLGVTGYIRGGCSPIGMKKKFNTFIDETCMLFDNISISAGARGCQVLIAPNDLIRYIGAELRDLTV